MTSNHKPLLGLILVLPIVLLQAIGHAAERPNIIFMLADDQGWNGLSVPMHPEVPESRGAIFHTPNLERLAARGMRFSQAYSPAPVCSPTRISLQTGKSPAQLHWTKAAPSVEGMRLTEPRLIKSIADNEVTIGELLRAQGYTTAHFGKWHISGGGPGRHGYDIHDGDTGNENAFKFEDPNPVDIFGMAERAEQVMTQSKQAGKPFFIQLSWNALHAYQNASKASAAKYKRMMPDGDEKQVYVAALTEDLDQGVGRVMDAVDQLGLTENTYVIYMSDNGSGGGGKRGTLRGGKGGVWEGGIRVPLIIQGPGVAANSWCSVPVVGYDFFSTFCDWAEVPTSSIPERVEGGSLREVLSHDGKGTVQRKFPGLVFHFPHYQSEGPQSSILLGSLKLVHTYEDDRWMLFDLSKDLAERQDLANKMPDEAQKMRTQLEEYLTAVRAQLPTTNPDFDPNKKPSEDSSRGKRGGGNRPGQQKGKGK
jgi:arylsulfatase A-like enzyme